MSVIYLKHPIHGDKVAALDLEAEADERNGWVRYTPGQPADPVVEAPPDIPSFLAPVGRRRRVDKGP